MGDSRHISFKVKPTIKSRVIGVLCQTFGPNGRLRSLALGPFELAKINALGADALADKLLTDT